MIEVSQIVRLFQKFRRLTLEFLRRTEVFRLFVLIPYSLWLFVFPIMNFRRLSRLDLLQLKNSEVFFFFKSNTKFESLDRQYFRREWTRLAWLAMAGDYHKANFGRTNLINEARSRIGLQDNFIPMMLEKGWTTHYGHLGCLLNFRNAQNLGIVSVGRRLVLRAETYKFDRPLYRTLCKDFDFINSLSSESIFEMEPFFPLTDKVSFTCTTGGFKELAEFFNLVSERQSQHKNFKRETLEFLDVELEVIKTLFQKYGYSHEHPFIALHIRETGDKYSARDSIASNFMPAIKELISLGMPVLRIGSPHASPLPSIPGLIDLRDAPKFEQQFLHDFAISNCKFLISSQSGPNAVAHALGVPTLTIDGVAVARYTYKTLALSMTLPKFWIDSYGRRLSYKEVFDFGLGFCELASSPNGFYLQNNSSSDILLAVKEFLKLVDSPLAVHENPNDFQALKTSFGGIGSGLISEVYLSI